MGRMSVTAAILTLLADGGKSIEDAIVVARAMERGDDARRVFSIVDTLKSQDRSPEDRAGVLLIYAQAVNRENDREKRLRFQPANGNRPESVYGPRARWGYEGPITPRLPDREWWPLRNYILDRDNHTCRYCGDRPERMCADHVVPLSRGGSNDEDNLVACCLPCNSSKCDRLLEEWEGRLTA
jgi:5-methylcytosine-specific restriction endonuclease McrA